jgi:HSP20 family protein
MLKTVNNELNTLLGGLLGEVQKTVNQYGEVLLADIKETPTSFFVISDIPGVKKEDIKITFEEGILRIETPERDLNNLAEGEKFLLAQRSNTKKIGYFKFRKNISPESIKASYKDGVLTVEIQKKEKESIKTIIVE